MSRREKSLGNQGGCLEHVGGLENLAGGEEQSQVVANGKETHTGNDHLQLLPATPQASNARVMGNRSYGFGVTQTASPGPLS